MVPTIKVLSEKKLVGKHLNMSLVRNETAALWKGVIMRAREVRNRIGSNLYSLQVYPSGYFENFDPAARFEKWALMEVADFSSVPEGMESFTLPGGLYAVFLYRGPASEGANAFQYIYGIWLPQSGYVLDERPHFEVLGSNYRNEGPESEEEIWIPVKSKKVGD